MQLEKKIEKLYWEKLVNPTAVPGAIVPLSDFTKAVAALVEEEKEKAVEIAEEEGRMAVAKWMEQAYRNGQLSKERTDD